MPRDEDKIKESDFKKLKNKKITIVGAGSTGCLVAYILAKLGLNLKIIDRDVVEEKNLIRQAAYSKHDIGYSKALILADKLNKYSDNKAIFDDLNFKTISYLKDSDLIIDCTDNVDVRFLINDYCKKNNLVWIHTAASKEIGTVMLVSKKGPCYRCIFNDKVGDVCDVETIEEKTLKSVASIACALAVQFLSNNSDEEPGLIRIDSNTENIVKLGLKKDKNCLTCSGKYEYLLGKRNPIKLCSKNRYIVETGKKIDLEQVSKKIAFTKKTREALINNDYTIIKNGRILVIAKDLVEAKKKFDKLGI